MVSVMLYPCILCVGVSVCLMCCVFDSVCVLFAILLNVMAVFSVDGSALLDRPCMVFQRMCVLCL